MDRENLIRTLTRRLAWAAQERDWNKLAQVENRLNAELPPLKGQEDWTPAERHALEDLRLAHCKARECCSTELAMLQKLMSEMRANRDGLLAYAQSSELTGE